MSAMAHYSPGRLPPRLDGTETGSRLKALRLAKGWIREGDVVESPDGDPEFDEALYAVIHDIAGLTEESLTEESLAGFVYSVMCAGTDRETDDAGRLTRTTLLAIPIRGLQDETDGFLSDPKAVGALTASMLRCLAVPGSAVTLATSSVPLSSSARVSPSWIGSVMDAMVALSLSDGPAREDARKALAEVTRPVGNVDRPASLLVLRTRVAAADGPHPSGLLDFFDLPNPAFWEGAVPAPTFAALSDWVGTATEITGPFGVVVEGLPLPVHVSAWQSSYEEAIDALYAGLPSEIDDVDLACERVGDVATFVASSDGVEMARASVPLSRFMPDPVDNVLAALLFPDDDRD